MIQVAAVELSSNNFYEVSISERATIGELKDLFASSCDLERLGMRIVWNERMTKDSEILADIGITDSSCLSIYARGFQEEKQEGEAASSEIPKSQSEEATQPKYNVVRMQQVIRSIYDMSRKMKRDPGPNKWHTAKLSLDHRYGDLFSDYQKYAVLLLCGGDLDERATKALEYNRVTDSLVADVFATCEQFDSTNIAMSGLTVRSLIAKHGLTDIWPSHTEQFAKNFVPGYNAKRPTIL